MTLQSVQGAIATIIAPVVMITACAVLISGMLAQYAQINDRLRSFARERLGLLRTDDGGLARVADLSGAYAQERLAELDAQIPRLLRRYRMVHNAVLTMYVAVLLFVVTMFAIGVAYSEHSSGWATAALLIFLAGMATMLVAIGVQAFYVYGANASVQYETQRILELGR